MAEWIEMTVGENVGIRLDKYLADQLTDYTRSFIQKQIEQEGVKVNNQIVN
ncbi:MAG: RNA pseudouridine synthase, partial [Cellulosilyticum sp.]|nr:RNA pseudouridine synthase [Cellulosilyticum sp.]